jgi:hypothetical protein
MLAFSRLFWYPVSIGTTVHSRRIRQISLEGDIVKITIILFVIAAIMFFVAGCGPGQPFEIEGMHTPQSESPAYVVAAG